MKKLLHTYLSLCTKVYDLSKPKPPQQEYSFYRNHVEATKGPVLEPMCGTGRFLLPLIAEGFDVHGFDASDHMLKALREKANLMGLKPTIWQAYAEHFNPKGSYNLIFIPSGSFGLIIDEKAAGEALRNFYRILNPEGVLVFEAETLKAIPKEFGVPRSSAYKYQDKMIIATFFDLPPKENVSTSISKYELIQDNDIIKTEIEEFQVRLYDPEFKSTER